MYLRNCRQECLPYRSVSLLFIVSIIFSLPACHRSYTKANKTKSDSKTVETSLTDIDGNTYPVLQIGEQLWMGSNLRVSHYSDGNPIQAGSGLSSLEESQSGAYVWYNNDKSHDETYGKLYNFKAVQEGNLCPEGWHIPTEGDWQQLLENTDENMLITAFSNQPGGFFNPQDIPPFSDAGNAAYWWSSTSTGRSTAASYIFRSDASSIERTGANEDIFYSIRCVKKTKQ